MMTKSPSHAPSPRGETDDPVAKAAATWVGQLARTLKTCRLYDGNNPTVVKFREDLAASLRRALEETGEWSLRFTAEDVLLDDVSLYPAKSREDNLSLPFFRDGVRGLTLKPGIAPAEVQKLLDCVLQVTGQSLTDDDLVTLLWEANLHHVDIDYVPAVDSGGGGAGGPAEGGEGELLPWPQPSAADEPAPQVESAQMQSGEGDKAAGRSDDWTTGQGVAEVEAEYEELAHLADTETFRFRQEYEAERNTSLVGSTLALARAYLAAGATPEDRQELGKFLPRLLRLAISNGAWREARDAVAMLNTCGWPEWSLEGFTQELLQPIAISGTVQHVDVQAPGEVIAFTALASELGDFGIDWLCQVLGESAQRGTRQLLAESIAQQCKDSPERLAPWLSDPRWYVVRNVVHILGWIGGPATAGLLQVAARHPELRVRTEVVGALGQLETRLARPILVQLLERADSRLFCAILHQLSAERDDQVSRLVFAYLQDPGFEQRPPEEQRAIYSTLGATSGDGLIADLEGELLKGSWFARYDAHRGQIARVLARIGTPLARQVLERNTASKRTAVRKACEDALAAFSARE